MIITENGWSDEGELEDVGRIEYLRVHLQAVLDAILRDRCNVVGHTTWSIIDNCKFKELQFFSENSMLIDKLFGFFYS